MDDLAIYELIVSQELTWEGLLRDIVKKENINPWDIDISFLSSKYLEALSNQTLTSVSGNSCSRINMLKNEERKILNSKE
jgi:hypothetical protein